MIYPQGSRKHLGSSCSPCWSPPGHTAGQAFLWFWNKDGALVLPCNQSGSCHFVCTKQPQSQDNWPQKDHWQCRETLRHPKLFLCQPGPQMLEGQKPWPDVPTLPPPLQWLRRVARRWRDTETSLLYSPADRQSRTKATRGLKTPFTEVPSIPNCIWRQRTFHVPGAGRETWTTHYPYQRPLPKHEHPPSRCQIVLSLGNYPGQENSRISQSLALFLWRHTTRERGTQILRRKKKCQNIGSILVLKK